jgi:hypothetical protein
MGAGPCLLGRPSSPWHGAAYIFYFVFGNTFCHAFALASSGMRSAFVRSIKEACLDQMVLFGAAALRNAVREFITHEERNHRMKTVMDLNRRTIGILKCCSTTIERQFDL